MKPRLVERWIELGSAAPEKAMTFQVVPGIWRGVRTGEVMGRKWRTHAAALEYALGGTPPPWEAAAE